MHKTRITELATIIADKTAVVDEYMKSRQLPSLSFEPDGPANIPIPPEEIEVIAAQNAVISSTQELHDLMKGPTEMLMGLCVSTRSGAPDCEADIPCFKIINPNDVLSLQAVYHFKLASSFPINGATTYTDLSAACGLNEADLRRLVGHAMTNHIFQEQNGMIVHTAASRILVDNVMMRDIVGVFCEEMFPGTARVSALETWTLSTRSSNVDGRCSGEVQWRSRPE